MTIQSNNIQANDFWLEVVPGPIYGYFKTNALYPMLNPNAHLVFGSN